MDHHFLSIKEAAKQYVVSDVTLRRLAREITRDERHESREYVRPGSVELLKLKEEKKPFEYELSTRLLGLRYKKVGEDSGEGSDTVNETRADVGSAAMNLLESTNDLLRDQLRVKDEQIRQLNDSLRSMQQQQNATNVLLVQLSERIPLLQGGTPDRTASAKRSPKISSKPAGRKEQSGGVVARLFRRSRSKARSAQPNGG